MFSENLKSTRKAKGLTQDEFAIRLNVVRQTISKWEKGCPFQMRKCLLKLQKYSKFPLVSCWVQKLKMKLIEMI